MTAGTTTHGLPVVIGSGPLAAELLCWTARRYGCDPQPCCSHGEDPMLMLVGDYDACHLAASAYWWSLPWVDEDEPDVYQ